MTIRVLIVIVQAHSIIGWDLNGSGHASLPAGNDFVAIAVGECEEAK